MGVGSQGIKERIEISFASMDFAKKILP